MVGVYLNHKLADSARRESLFKGELHVQPRNAATEALALHAQEMARTALAPLDPERAQFDLSVEDFVTKVGPLKSTFTNALRTKELVRDVLVSFGIDVSTTYFDVPRLRVVPHGGYLSAGVSYAYKAHRDIWYSSPNAQVNWWMPVFDVTAERAMSFFPEYWTKGVPNSSAEFDYGEWCRVGRQQATQQIKQDTRRHPLPLDAVDTASELRIAGGMGDMLMFSAAHLHATAANESGKTRFSLDFRTLAHDDLVAGRGAHNVDNKATGTTLGDFLRADDFTPIDVRQFEMVAA